MVNRVYFKPDWFCINGFTIKVLLFYFFFHGITFTCHAQTMVLSYPECLAIALDNTIVRSKSSALKRFEIEIATTKNSFLPSLAINTQNNYSVGRVLDPTTYQFITNHSVYDMSASIGGSMTLFSGLERFHQVKKAELNAKSAELDLKQTKNELALEVTRLFLEILMDKEAVGVYENKISLLKKQECG